MRVRSLTLLALVTASRAFAQGAPATDPDVLGTYSIIARDPATGELGLGVQSKAFASGNRAMTLKGGLAVIAHQASANPMYGRLGLELLAAGMTPQQALDLLLRSDEGRDNRQVAILDAQGRAASWTGKGANDWKGHKCGADYCAQGNILTGPEVVDALARTFEAGAGPFAERLLAALDAAQAAGGDARGMQSAALMIVRPLGGAAGFSDRVIDLRVDDHPRPLDELRRLVDLTRSGELIAEANRRLSAGDLDSALKAATAARDKSPRNDNAWVALATVHLKANRKRDALEALAEAIDRNPAQRRQLPRNRALEGLHGDAGFIRLIAPPSSPATRPTDKDLQQVVDDYVRLYARETLARWRTLFLPGFVASFTNDDGTVTHRSLDEFYARQQSFFATGRTIREELRNPRTTRQGRLAQVVSDFVLFDGNAARPGRLALLLVEDRGRFRIASLTFTYHLQ